MSDGKDISSRLGTHKYVLEDFQAKCMKHIVENYFTTKQIEDGSSGCICDLPCGRGKTLMGLEVVRLFKRRALIVCHACSPVKQWMDHFAKFLPDLVVEQYDTTLGMTSDVVVTTVHSLALYKSRKKHNPAEFNKWLGTFGTFVFDEIHAYGSKENAIVFDLVYPRHIFGLSATPERTDWMEKMYGDKVGPIIYATEKLGIVPPRFEAQVRLMDPEVGVNLISSANDTAKAIQALTLDPQRYASLCSVLKFQFAEDPAVKIIIFCNYHAEVEFLYTRLYEDFTVHPPEAIGKKMVETAYSTASPEQIATAADNADILVGSYAKIGTGFSAVKFTSLHIWSTTRKRHKQAIGRICRWKDGDEAHNKKTRIIYDWIDRQTIASSQYYVSKEENGKISPSRRATYKEMGWAIITPKVGKSLTTKKLEEKQKLFADLGFE
jgi:hypothetical protein